PHAHPTLDKPLPLGRPAHHPTPQVIHLPVGLRWFFAWSGWFWMPVRRMPAAAGVRLGMPASGDVQNP
ncbi:hypothetical protein, partial [Kitasatospora sp. MAP5-34]|uniref:hypothetical protein n=1 Tax=Kitasatospora sp. MAP5-34 TaxID=3035102 RepID=UPI0024745768